MPGIIFACVFGFYGFVIAERGDGVGVIESLQRSADVTRGHRWQLFGLGVVLFLINVVGALLFLVGLIFTLGISLLAWAYTYRTLSGESVERTAWPERSGHARTTDPGRNAATGIFASTASLQGERRVLVGEEHERYAFTRIVHRITPTRTRRRLSGHAPVMITAKNATMPRRTPRSRGRSAR